MRLEQQLQQFNNVPFSRSSLLSVLHGYSRPNDKIASLAGSGVLVPLKKGVYVLGAEWRRSPLSLPLIANNLYGPSCVSLEWALAWHGLIPEGVFDVTSVTSRRNKQYETPVGRFSYQRLEESLLYVGARVQETDGQACCLLAGPTKALCDQLLLTRNLRLFSASTMEVFLEEDLRIDRDSFEDIELDVVASYLEVGHKSRLLELLGDVLESWS
jgi:hypothetical protein